MIQSLGQSMSRIVSYIQEEIQEDDDIQSLAQALNTKLSIAS
jgi:hypothetical protein